LDDKLEEIESEHGAARAVAFQEIVLGLATPLATHIETWLIERKMKPRQESDYRRALVKLVAWINSENLPVTIEGVTRKLAGRYISEGMVSKGAHWRSINKDISAITSYWKWLIKRGHVEANPWTGQSLPKSGYNSAGKRPVTDDELKKLLHGETHQWLLDSVKILALSAIRAGELAALTVERCKNGVFQVRDAKTKAGNRDVPIHSGLKKLIAKRMKRKGPNDFLIHELPTPKPDSKLERSMPISKHFIRYRISLGIDQKALGHRQSAVDLHSLRRWAITKMDQAGCRKEDVERIAGHAIQSMSLGLYSGGSSIEQLRKVIETIKLPR
jgi:integrase